MKHSVQVLGSSPDRDAINGEGPAFTLNILLTSCK